MSCKDDSGKNINSGQLKSAADKYGISVSSWQSEDQFGSLAGSVAGVAGKEAADAAKIAAIAQTATKIDQIYWKPGVTLPKKTLAVDKSATAAGKRLVVFGENLLGPNESTRALGVEYSPESAADLLRLELGRYWAIDENDSLVYLNSQNSRFSIENFNFASQKISVPDKAKKNNGFFSSTEQWVLIRPNKNKFLIRLASDSVSAPQSSTTSPGGNKEMSVKDQAPPAGTMSSLVQDTIANQTEKTLVYNPEYWKMFVKGGITSDGKQFGGIMSQGKEFVDYNFSMVVPFEDKELTGFSGYQAASIYSVDFAYNYYVDRYEKALSEIDHSFLPHLYYLFFLIENQETNQDITAAVTLAGALKVGAVLPAVNSKNIGMSIQKYYGTLPEQYSFLQSDKTLSSKQAKASLEAIREKISRLVVPTYGQDFMRAANEKKSLFPMYTRVSFATDTRTSVAQVLADSKLGSIAIKNIIEDEAQNKIAVEQSVLASELQIQNRTDFGAVIASKENSYERRPVKTWTIDSWVKEFSLSGTESEAFSFDLAQFLDVNESAIVNFGAAKNKFFREFMKYIFIGKMRKLVSTNTRTFEEILAGRVCYSETLFYRVDKFLASADNKPLGNPIAQYYFANSNQIKDIELVDTQVKYGQPYAYVVSAYQMVVGAKYIYSDLEVTDDAAWFKLKLTPSVVLQEVPYFTFGGAVVDSPPIAPGAEIIPYKGVKNSVLLWLKGEAGQEERQPISILSDDVQNYSELRQKMRLDGAAPILFKSDDPAQAFQVFRMSDAPTSYADFSDSLRATIETDVDANTLQKAAASSFVDDIEPNKKYWYCFRSVDVHGHVSLPTQVYQLEMVDDGGTIFPLVEMYNFPTGPQGQKTLSLRKYLQIKPRLSQVIVNEAKSDTGVSSANNAKNIVLGVNDETLWGKKFKLRLTSKNTGKKIDLNVSFETKVVRTEEGE